MRNNKIKWIIKMQKTMQITIYLDGLVALKMKTYSFIDKFFIYFYTTDILRYFMILYFTFDIISLAIIYV